MEEWNDLDKKIIEEYEINANTMCIVPVVYGSKIYSLIYETDGVFLSPFKPLDIIKYNCEFYCSNYDSRRKATKNLTGYTRKGPLGIEPSINLFFFPTCSPENSLCSWISPSHIGKYLSMPNNQVQVLFINNQSILFDISISTLKTQIERTSHVKIQWLQRIEKYGNKKKYYLINRPKTMKASETSREYKEREKDPNPK